MSWLRRLASDGSSTIVAAVIGLTMLAAAILIWGLHLSQAGHRVLLAGIVLTGAVIVARPVRELLRGNFSVDVLAVLSITVAAILGQYWVAAIVILMLSGGEALEAYATRRASSVLSALAKRMPQTAHLVHGDGSMTDIHIDQIAVGQQLRVFPNEICPVDGTVIAGTGSMDESYLTGEPFQIEKTIGTSVLSGAINGSAALTIQATRIAADSRYARIVEVLHASEQQRPRIRRLGDRIGGWYTPLALAIALVSGIASHTAERFLAVLVIATPCPLLLAIPVAVIGAISVAASRGILIKDPSILEKLDSCRTLVVDKTGTLTYGKPYLREIVNYAPWDKNKLLSLTASLERYSKHPLAEAILDAAKEKGLPLAIVNDVSELPGKGLAGHVEGHVLTVTGRGKLSPELRQMLSPVTRGLECVVLCDEALAGVFHFEDRPRSDSRSFLRHMGKHGIERIVMLSGDRPQEVEAFAGSMGITEVHGGMSPEQKVEEVRQLTAAAPTLYLGDGINDAPAMITATAGVALGLNSDITAEAAGAVVLQSSLTSVDELIHIGKRMRRIALQSAVGGMSLSMIGMIAAALGYLSPIQGAITQEFIDLLSILNSLRIILPTGPLSDFRSSESAPAKNRP
ncbi:MAG TPA: heavy metal translocating P-type ATPase [Edaphobacter sp.]|nr:heavy metal translocating P-type ATPase [Edaphobacter sp.]